MRWRPYNHLVYHHKNPGADFWPRRTCGKETLHLTYLGLSLRSCVISGSISQSVFGLICQAGTCEREEPVPFPASWQKLVLMNYRRNFCLWGMGQLSGCYRLVKEKVIPAFVVHPRAGARIGIGQIFLGWLGAARDNNWAQVKAFWMGMPTLEGILSSDRGVTVLPLVYLPVTERPSFLKRISPLGTFM